MAIAFIICASLVSKGHAQKNTYPIGELIALEGKAYYVGDHGKSEIKTGAPIYFNSNIQTAPGAKALILFIDDTEITLAEDSTMTIDEYVFDPYDPAENKAKFNFLKGAFLWSSGLISKKDTPDVTLETSRGSIGIRGTTVWGGQTDGGYGVFVADGAVNFSDNWGGVDIPAGKGFILSDNNLAKDTKDANTWKKPILDKALRTITFTSPLLQKQTQHRLKDKKKQNIAKRHDYRGQMFPYKENPFQKRLKAQDDKFFSDEFEEMRNK